MTTISWSEQRRVRLMTTGATAIFEGITVNKASELLYGTNATTKARESSSLSYIDCLERVSLA
jgi:hypothetical protein